MVPEKRIINSLYVLELIRHGNDGREDLSDQSRRGTNWIITLASFFSFSRLDSRMDTPEYLFRDNRGKVGDDIVTVSRTPTAP